MKVNVSVEATAQEMREFLGLPNVQPLHDDVMNALRDSMQRGVINFDALGLMKPLFPHLTSMELVQKFWESVAKASGGQVARAAAEKKSDNSFDPADNSAVRNDAEKP